MSRAPERQQLLLLRRHCRTVVCANVRLCTNRCWASSCCCSPPPFSSRSRRPTQPSRHSPPLQYSPRPRPLRTLPPPTIVPPLFHRCLLQVRPRIYFLLFQFPAQKTLIRHTGVIVLSSVCCNRNDQREYFLVYL